MVPGYIPPYTLPYTPRVHHHGTPAPPLRVHAVRAVQREEALGSVS